ncbi:MAG: glycosyltransferase family 2 protein [Rhodobacteraceae bacterium]|nr:glycosyltransferase family 2 protein [Paracoccaceae bacterium]
MDVTVITVAYHSLAVLPAMAGSLPPGVPLVVVDNAGEAGLADWAAGQGVRLIPSPGNIGFGRGCNLGAAEVTTGFLLFLNPDARLHPGCLATLLDAARRHPAAVAFGPTLTDATGRISYKRLTDLSPTDRFAPAQPPQRETEMPVLSGAALLVRRSAFQAVGGFDPAIFLYYEDDDLSLRLRAACGPLVLVPSARVTHQPGSSTPRSPALSWQRGYHLSRSYIHAARKHGLPLPRVLGWIKALGFCLERQAWRNASGRAHARGRLAGAWHG